MAGDTLHVRLYTNPSVLPYSRPTHVLMFHVELFGRLYKFTPIYNVEIHTCLTLRKIAIWMSKNCQKKWQKLFFEQNCQRQFCWNKWQFVSIFLTKCQFMGNFLTFKRQFSVGSGRLYHLVVHAGMVPHLDVCLYPLAWRWLAWSPPSRTGAPWTRGTAPRQTETPQRLCPPGSAVPPSPSLQPVPRECQSVDIGVGYVWVMCVGLWVVCWPSGKLQFECQKIAKKLDIFSKKLTKIVIFFFQNNRFLKKSQVFSQFFDIQIAIFRRVRFWWAFQG